MADNKKISELTEATTLSGSEIVEIVQSEENKKLSLSTLKTFANGGEWSSNISDFNDMRTVGVYGVEMNNATLNPPEATTSAWYTNYCLEVLYKSNEYLIQRAIKIEDGVMKTYMRELPASSTSTNTISNWYSVSSNPLETSSGSNIPYVLGGLYLATEDSTAEQLLYWLNDIDAVSTAIENLQPVAMNNYNEYPAISTIEYFRYSWSDTNKWVGFKIPLWSSNAYRVINIKLTDPEAPYVTSVDEGSIITIS